MKTERVEKGLLAENNSAFIAFYTKPYYHYQQLEECRDWGDHIWFSKIPLIGLMNRIEARYGFVGGKVDEGETLLQAAVRECKEEIDGDINEEQLTLVCSHSMTTSSGKNQNTHFYVCEVTPEELYDLQKKSVHSLHSRVECSGYNIVPLCERSIGHLLDSVWAGTAKEEFNILIESDFFEGQKTVIN